MSRLFEYLKKTHRLPTTATHNSSETRPILSVLELPQALTNRAATSQTFEGNGFPVAKVDIQPEDRLFFHDHPGGPAADRIRLLRMRLQALGKAGKLKTLLITSPLPGEGKSTIAMNLATALAEQEQSVLLIDCDLHRASITRRLVPNASGVADCISRHLDPFTAIHRVEPLGWNFLPAGTTPPNPSEALHSDELTGVLQRLSAAFDWILLDSPPVIPVTGAVLLSARTDGTLLTVRADHTTNEAFQKAIALIGPKRVTAVILNGVGSVDRAYRNSRPYYDMEAR